MYLFTTMSLFYVNFFILYIYIYIYIYIYGLLSDSHFNWINYKFITRQFWCNISSTEISNHRKINKGSRGSNEQSVRLFIFTVIDSYRQKNKKQKNNTGVGVILPAVEQDFPPVFSWDWDGKRLKFVMHFGNRRWAPGLMRHLAWETRSQRLTFRHYLGSTHKRMNGWHFSHNLRFIPMVCSVKFVYNIDKARQSFAKGKLKKHSVISHQWSLRRTQRIYIYIIKGFIK